MKTLRQQTIDREVDEINRRLHWLKPDVAADVCRQAYQRQQHRLRDYLITRHQTQRIEG